jgi:hypothetical protein
MYSSTTLLKACGACIVLILLLLIFSSMSVVCWIFTILLGIAAFAFGYGFVIVKEFELTPIGMLASTVV